MTKKITLYNPKTGELRDYHGAPIGLIAISRFLYKDNYQIDIVEHFEKGVEQKIISSCKNSTCLGITCMTGYQIKDSLKIAKIIKKKYPSLPIIWGGWHPSILPEQTLENPYVDFVVRGQGDITFTELVHAIEKKETFENIKGISYKRKGKMIHNPDREFIDINSLPPLPYELLNLETHILNSEFGARTINYYASQGCPYRCGFCADPQVYRRKYTMLSPERIVSDLSHLKKKYKVDSIIFADSNFFISEQHTKDFCKLCIKSKLNLKFGQVDGRSNILARYSDETWLLMKKAGFVNILNGTESGSQKILDFINKDATIEDTIKLVKQSKKYGITLVCSTFIGLPTQNIKKEFNTNVMFIDKLMKINNNNTYYLLTYTPYPGSPLYNLSIQQGFKPPKNLEQWSEFELHKITTPWVTKKYVNLGEQFDLYYFPFLGNQLRQIVNHYSGIKKIIGKIAFFIFSNIVKIRWKFKFFDIPLDYALFKFLIFMKDKLAKT
ncbi:MAG: radical SAM protein [Candidatus Woesearchaeota archaeon]|jgi:radical SAM superfamily enzyme YgiQ (UPF0313 family)